MRCSRRAPATARVDFPAHAYVGETRDCTVTVARRQHARAARGWRSSDSPLVAIEDDGRLRVPLDGGRGAVLLPLDMLRRGMARFDRLWLRWTGPLGLAWRQRSVDARRRHSRSFPTSGRCTTRARASSSATRSKG